MRGQAQSRFRGLLASRQKRAMFAVGVIVVVGAIIGISVGVSQSKSSSPGKVVPVTTIKDVVIVPTGSPTPQPTPVPGPTPTGGVPSTTNGVPTPAPTQLGTTLIPTSSPTMLSEVIQSMQEILKPHYPGERFQALNTPNTPQNKALMWIATNPNFKAYSPTVKIQRFTLASIYYSLGGEGWFKKGRWITTSDECFWDGVSCKRGRVTEINLGSNNMTGVFPTEFDILKEFLTKLSIPNNNIQVSNLIDLLTLVNLEYLDLDNNSVDGNIPDQIDSLSNLKTLKLSNNSVVGDLPVRLFDMINLEVLSLGDNFFSGLSDKIGQLINLKEFMFDRNDAATNVTSPRNFNPKNIPTTLGYLKKLKTLSMNEQKPPFQGRLPSELGLLTALTTLSVMKNQIVGELPPEIYNLKELSNLGLGANKMNGTLSSEVKNFGNMETLIINDNQFEKTIPTEVGKMAFLTHFIADAVSQLSLLF